MGTIWDILGSVYIWGDGINLDPSPRHSSLRPGSPRTSVMKLEDDEPKPLGPSQGLVLYSHVGPKRKQQLKESDTSALWVLACWENIINKKFPFLWFIRYLNFWLVRSLFGDWTSYLFSQTLTSIFLCLQLDPTSHLSPYSECKKI